MVNVSSSAHSYFTLHSSILVNNYQLELGVYTLESVLKCDAFFGRLSHPLWFTVLSPLLNSIFLTFIPLYISLFLSFMDNQVYRILFCIFFNSCSCPNVETELKKSAQIGSSASLSTDQKQPELCCLSKIACLYYSPEEGPEKALCKCCEDSSFCNSPFIPNCIKSDICCPRKTVFEGRRPKCCGACLFCWAWDSRNFRGETELYNAAKKGKPYKVWCLLKCGADPNVTSSFLWFLEL